MDKNINRNFFKDAIEDMRANVNKWLKDNNLLVNTNCDDIKMILHGRSRAIDDIELKINLKGFNPEYFTFDGFCKSACLESSFDTHESFLMCIRQFLGNGYSTENENDIFYRNLFKDHVVEKSKIEDYVKNKLKKDVKAFINFHIKSQEENIAHIKFCISNSKASLKKIEKMK